MNRFDQRAEGAAEGRRRDDGDATEGFSRADRNAVRSALGTGHKKLEDDLSSLEVVLHANPANPNAPVEQGPPVPGDPSFNLAVEFFERVVDDLFQIYKATLKLKIDRQDKEALAGGVARLGNAWGNRRVAFASTDPGKAATSFKLAQKQEKEAEPALRVLEKYFPSLEEVES
jgi:hypothetical protein